MGQSIHTLAIAIAGVTLIIGEIIFQRLYKGDQFPTTDHLFCQPFLKRKQKKISQSIPASR